MSIEEIIKGRYPNKCLCRDNVTIRYPILGCPIHGIQVYRDIQTLISFLEKEEQAHVMSRYDLNMKIAEVEIALEKEKQNHIDTIRQLEKAAGKHLNNLMKISKLEAALKQEKEENARLNRVYDLELERVNKAENKYFQISLELAKERERAKELEGFNKGISKLYEERGRQVGDLEAQLASIKADESIGKLVVEDSFGEDD